jgi:hypothetical protein
VSDETTKRITRRDALRKGAKLGGAVLWIAPAIQTLPRPAFAQTGSPLFTCCECRTITGGSGFTPGQEDCDGPNTTNCVTGGSGPSASEGVCSDFCATLGRTYCFHSGPTPFNCVGQACVAT